MYSTSIVLRAKADACWDRLIFVESDWNPNAVNRTSGACSLAQALPCSKIKGDWTDPEIALKWMEEYIENRYGSTCNALRAWESRTPHWY